MSDQDKVMILRSTLERIREATFAEFQLEMEPRKTFDPKKHACPLCRRASTADNLKLRWAGIQSDAANALRDTD